MKNFIQPGKTLTLTAPVGGVIGGNFYFIGSAFGVACGSADAGEKFDLDVSGGVFELTKNSAEAWTEGAPIYATAAGVMTVTSTDNTKVGIAVAAAANPSGVGRVRLNASF
ncbi:conserved hypothetical protein [uncultured Pleomorphomonas sp.]|uniref:DUF2190 family protein n=1 Tax=uncultured Pleomorphomonas sp. TaxID=442121 RepID=A0A212LR52_9HYPH|nr:DUF2190 family protein [uncultured Pleomorphomonas sp.]SCM79961.1 conserved hypothetical protein [uncultured Pleomorphomonas sp.]